MKLLPKNLKITAQRLVKKLPRSHFKSIHVTILKKLIKINKHAAKVLAQKFNYLCLSVEGDESLQMLF